MSLKLLDIRYGRINRRQFSLCLLILSLLNVGGWYLAQYMSTLRVMAPIAIISLYFIGLLLARRLHDIGYSSKWMPLLFVPFAIPTISMIVTIFYTPPEVNEAIIWAIYINLAFKIVAIVIVLSLVFSPSSLGPNKWGYPPVSFDPETMVSGDENGEWKKQIDDANLRSAREDLLMEHAKEKLRHEDQDEVKALNEQTPSMRTK